MEVGLDWFDVGLGGAKGCFEVQLEVGLISC